MKYFTWASVGIAFFGATTNGSQMMDLEELSELSGSDEYLLNQIDIALEAADEYEAVLFGPATYQDYIKNNQNYASTDLLGQNQQPISLVDQYGLPSFELGFHQCTNVCYSQDKTKVDECKAYCYASHFPKNSNLNLTNSEDPILTCGKIKVKVFTDKYCSKLNDEKTTQVQTEIDEDAKQYKCRREGSEYHGLVCDQSSLRHSVFIDDKCDGSKLTYAYEWNKCVEYDSANGLYVVFKNAKALTVGAIGTALLLFSAHI